MNIFSDIKDFLKTRTLRESSYVFVGSAINGVSLFAINVFLGNRFSKEWFGTFSLIIVVLAVVSELSDFGLNGGMMRFAPYYIGSGENDKFLKLVKVVWGWRVKISSVLTIGGIIFAYPLSRYVIGQPQIASYLAFSFLGIGGVILLGFISSYLQVQQKFLLNSFLQVLKGVGKLVLIACLMFFGFSNLYPYISIYIIVPWFLVFSFFILKPDSFLKIHTTKEEKSEINIRLGKFGFWLALNSVFMIIAGKVDQIMVSRILDLEKLATFSIAMQFLYFYSLVLGSISSVITPKINSLRNKLELISYIKKSYRILIPVFIVALFLIFPTKYLIILFFGQKYLDAIPIYLILSYSTLSSLIFLPFSLVLLAYSKTKLIALSGFLQFIINLALNWFFIRTFGLVGAAISYGISVILFNLYNVFWSLYLLKYREIIV
ncbi:MAG: polysaccharide biosynthesis C-terminal domain-containing protein [Patescibacteria group bacterium]|jgi:O-antigen/teichoic acid export membrane protein